MVVGNVKANTTTPHVRSVSYTGKFPNRCSGTLTLEIDGKEYRFGNFTRFWESGGCCTIDENGCDCVETGEWLIDVDELPKQFQKYTREIDAVFNENVPWGCCGGCL